VATLSKPTKTCWMAKDRFGDSFDAAGFQGEMLK
jgi:hypothetical protein